MRRKVPVRFGKGWLKTGSYGACKIVRRPSTLYRASEVRVLSAPLNIHQKDPVSPPGDAGSFSLSRNVSYSQNYPLKSLHTNNHYNLIRRTDLSIDY